MNLENDTEFDIILPVNRHEYWVLDGLLPIAVDNPRRNVRLQPSLWCDALFEIEQPDPFWAGIGPWLAGRTVVFEHYSASISASDFCACSTKLNVCTQDYHKTRTRSPARPPCLLMTTPVLPRNHLRDSAWRASPIAGIYLYGTEQIDFRILVVTARLPKDPEWNGLRLCGRAPEASEPTLESLRQVRNLSTMEERKLKEAGMITKPRGKITSKELVRLMLHAEDMEQLAKEKEQLAKEKEQLAKERELEIKQQMEQLIKENELLRKQLETR